MVDGGYAGQESDKLLEELKIMKLNASGSGGSRF